MDAFVNLTNYTPVGDLTVVSVCLVMIVLLFFSYNRRTRSFGIFLSIVGLLILSALSSVSYHLLATAGKKNYYIMAYFTRCVYHALLFSIFLLFVVYIVEVTRLERRLRVAFIAAAVVILSAVVLADVVNTVRGTGLLITGNDIALKRRNVFMYGYMCFSVLLVALMLMVRNRLYKRVMMGFYGTMIISFAILLIQGRHNQSSFTVATFLYPVLGMFYVLHSNPYDVEIGAIDANALKDTVRYNFEKKREFVFMSLYLRSFDEEGTLFPEALQALIRKFSTDYFKGALLFQAGNGHEILLFLKRRNPDYRQKIQQILLAFDVEYRRYHYDYKIVIGESIDEISRKNEYVSFIQSIHQRMADNAIHRVDAKDVALFNRTEYILRELEDIYRGRDLDDPRVLAYCQPVYNIKSHRYDTAEALMRLKLKETGLVFPDQFIPMAEKNGFIHMLTEIILHKTCLAVRALIEAGCAVTRVSVNVSMLELKDGGFCDDIMRIIDQSGIPGDKIAIELTESQTDSDFLLMKDKIGELRKRGIKFYLDDFGTGYSNMERIMELPFDIIKFDRSMVLACGASERSRKIVIGLANLFAELHYAVLYEGVEKESDEQMCIGMSASYLQGYKYSKPVPIEGLAEYFAM